MTRQKLGQHFLIDTNTLQQIAEGVCINAGETIIEIGPGHGELTLRLVEIMSHTSDTHIILIEKDTTLIPHLSQLFKAHIDSHMLEIRVGDALTLIPELTATLQKKGAPYKIVGNIPYYITGFLFRVIGELIYKPTMCVFMIQKEVAERVTATPPEMNLLSASVQLWARTTLLFKVPKRFFSPPPQVDSAVISLITRPTNTEITSEHFYECIKALFKQPRKTILNNLKALPRFASMDKEKIDALFARIHHTPQDRPQDMHIESIILLTHLLYND
jgi:16S rRNA (adenine1518-N6/adenine1519-N6)-dimethyltransferase